MRLVLLLIASVAAASAAPQEFMSGTVRTHVLELFTSEGCSSCPPAEAWLAGLRNNPALWREVVPIAWHVNYWDRLGWKDRFASKEATARQYAYASQWGSDSVYTPCLVLDGHEARDRAVPPASREIVGMLKASYDGQRVQVRFEPAVGGEYDVHGAILALGIQSAVRAGENSGRTLHHDFVVATPIASAALHGGGADLRLATPGLDGASNFALAVWITRRNDLVPVQATGGLLSAH